LGGYVNVSVSAAKNHIRFLRRDAVAVAPFTPLERPDKSSSNVPAKQRNEWGNDMIREGRIILILIIQPVNIDCPETLPELF
jgi:hypothetical protein